MSARSWLWAFLTTTPEIVNLIGGEDDPRVFAKKTMTSSVEQCPYIVYKMGYSAPEGLSETEDASRQFAQVWIHDYSDGKTADYAKIDEVVEAIKSAIKLQNSAEDAIILARYLETSQDLNDETLNTVFRYVRIQIILKEEA